MKCRSQEAEGEGTPERGGKIKKWKIEKSIWDIALSTLIHCAKVFEL